MPATSTRNTDRVDTFSMLTGTASISPRFRIQTFARVGCPGNCVASWADARCMRVPPANKVNRADRAHANSTYADVLVMTPPTKSVSHSLFESGVSKAPRVVHHDRAVAR